MALQIGDTAPDFEAETTEGPIRFHDWIGDSWAVLFSHPKDFTPVCTTELGYMAKIKPEFDRRNVKIIGLSVDPLDNHAKWAEDIEETQGQAPNYPIIGDSDFNVSKLYGMLPASVSGDPTERTPADNQTVRNVFVIGPDKKVKLILVYPMTTGRNFDEVLRVIDSLQLTAKHKVATPVNWQEGEDVIIAGSVSDDEAQARSIPTAGSRPRPYIRIVPQPRSIIVLTRRLPGVEEGQKADQRHPRPEERQTGRGRAGDEEDEDAHHHERKADAVGGARGPRRALLREVVAALPTAGGALTDSCLAAWAGLLRAHRPAPRRYSRGSIRSARATARASPSRESTADPA